MLDRLSAVKKVDQKLGEIIFEDLPILSEVKKLVTQSGGKRIRPLLHYYFTQILGYNGKEWVDVGAIGEMIHAASLLHDDVVDESSTRRGVPSANAIYGNKAAVLAGDYLLSCALQHISTLEKSQEILVVFTRVVRMLSVGELIQMQKEKDLDMKVEEYEAIIHGKTGSLFGAMAEAAAILSGADRERANEYRIFGEKLGAVFQRRDDYLDYFVPPESTGKPAFQDFERGLVTGPVLLMRSQLSGEDVTMMRNLWGDEAKRKSPEGLQILDGLLQRSNLKKRAADQIEDDLDSLDDFLVKHSKSSYINDIKKQIDKLRVGRIG